MNDAMVDRTSRREYDAIVARYLPLMAQAKDDTERLSLLRERDNELELVTGIFRMPD